MNTLDHIAQTIIVVGLLAGGGFVALALTIKLGMRHTHRNRTIRP